MTSSQAGLAQCEVLPLPLPPSRKSTEASKSCVAKGEEMLSSKELTMLIDQTRTQPKRKFMRDVATAVRGTWQCLEEDFSA